MAPPATLADEVAAALGKTVLSDGQPPLNIFRTLALHPALLKRFNVFAGFFIGKGTLSARVRELLILRVAERCECRYEWEQHLGLARGAGLSNDDIAAIERGELSHPWPPAEAAALRLCDDILDSEDVSDETWSALQQTSWAHPQIIEMIMLVGFYRMVAGFLRGLRVPLDAVRVTATEDRS